MFCGEYIRETDKVPVLRGHTECTNNYTRVEEQLNDMGEI
jgi:hypothetical protein